MRWPFGWPLLILALFAHEPYKEQLLAGQTIICCMTQQLWPFHTATVISIIIYFTHQDVRILSSAIILHHLIVVCAIVGQYLEFKYKGIIWVLMIWSTRWLGTISIFYSPIRSTIKFILFRCIANRPWSENNKYGLKWCWILFTHEIMWCLLPIQILYEVYYCNKKQLIVAIV